MLWSPFIGTILLIKQPKAEFIDVTKYWYADDAGALGTFANVNLYFNFLKRFGLGCGYYPEPSKIVLIAHPYNLKSGKRFGLCHGFKVCTITHYIDSFIGDNESK